MNPSLAVVSYNILADAHIRSEWYPQTPVKFLWWEQRKNRLTKKLKEFRADVVCLQEVEPDAFEFIEQHLQPHGYQGIYAQKGNGKPDGCATFFKSTALNLNDYQTIYYSDKGTTSAAHSGHLVLIAEFKFDFGIVKIANTHLKWEDKESAHRIGSIQAKELAIIIANDEESRWIVCGDFNAQTDSIVIDSMLEQNLHDAYESLPQPTCNSNREAKRIDFIFHSRTMNSTPTPIVTIDDATTLPSASEPSDHLAIAAQIFF